MQSIPGYTYGSPALGPSPLNHQDLELLKASLLFTDDDHAALRQAGEVLADQVEEILDVWYGFVAAHPHLVYYFGGPDGNPSPEYLAAVRKRFGQWILDTCQRPYDARWLAYQHEIGLRHHRSKKNQTDGFGAAPQVPMRYIVAFIYLITVTLRPFLAKKGHPQEQVERMHQAWFKAVVLQALLWCYPYVKEGDF